ncbi:MAG TPA: VWA domain-containing protein [Bryobacteraceae bacterium]|nr:VWA domain-containing protein [Bryobacteraceae bacterium]
MQSMNRKALPYFLLSAGLLAMVFGQTQNPPAPQSQPKAAPAATGAKDNPVVFKTTAQLVVETVTVKDKNGNVIEGLTAKDFAITEDNVPQNVAFCEFQKFNDLDVAELKRRPEPAAAPPDDKPKVAPVTDTQIMPEAPGDIRYRNRRMIVLYFDMAGMPEADQFRAQYESFKFIRTKMQPADMVAVVKFSDGVKVLQDFTDDRGKLMQALENLKIGEAQGFDEVVSDDSSADTGTAFGEDDSEFNLFNTDRQLAALQTTVKMLGALNEKKVLVYFASGLNLNGTDNQAQYQATVNSAARANVAFWTVDARGLVATAPLGDATRGSPGGVGMYNGASALATQTYLQRSQDTMYGLANDTGGKALLDNNELSQGIVNAEESISSYYILGYYSKNEALDGKFRRIKVTYLGDASAKLSYRSGYFAGKTFNKFTAADKDRQLQDALMLGDPITDLTISMEVNYFQLNGAEYYIPVTMKIPGSELALARRGGAERTTIDFIVELKDEYNSTVDNVRDHVDKKLTGETAAQLARQPIQYQTAFTQLPGTYTVKVLARDDETGRIGTYISKFVIPNLNKEVKRIPISSVVLSGQRIAIADALMNVKDKSGPSVSPLIQDGMQVIPSVTRVFSKSRDMYVYLQAYERGATSTQPLVAYVSFYRGASKAFETAPLPVTEGLDPKSKAVPLKFSLALGKLPPGKYNCQVTVLDPAGSRAAFWQAPVMLVQ